MTTPKASDAAIERACERMNSSRSVGGLPWEADDYESDVYTNLKPYADDLRQFSDALRAEHGDNVPASLAGFVLPVVVDPIVEAARRICEAVAHEIGAQFEGKYADGTYDNDDEMQFAIAELRVIAAQGGAN